MGLSASWKKKLHSDRPVASGILEKLYSNSCGYLLIIRHLAKNN